MITMKSREYGIADCSLKLDHQIQLLICMIRGEPSSNSVAEQLHGGRVHPVLHDDIT